MRLAADQRYAGFALRVAALVLDLLCVAVALGVAAGLVYSSGYAQELVALGGGAAVLGTAVAALLAVATVLCWRLWGATPGLALVGVVLIDARSGRRLSWWQSLVRLLTVPFAVLPLGLGLLWMVWDRRRQAWPDKLARTLAVIEEEWQMEWPELVREP